jgi:hypothetical protein
MQLCNVHIIVQFVGAGDQEEWHDKTALSYTVGYQYSFLRSVSSDTKKGKLISKTGIRQYGSDIGKAFFFLHTYVYQVLFVCLDCK